MSGTQTGVCPLRAGDAFFLLLVLQVTVFYFQAW